MHRVKELFHFDNDKKKNKPSDPEVPSNPSNSNEKPPRNYDNKDSETVEDQEHKRVLFNMLKEAWFEREKELGPDGVYDDWETHNNKTRYENMSPKELIEERKKIIAETRKIILIREQLERDRPDKEHEAFLKKQAEINRKEVKKYMDYRVSQGWELDDDGRPVLKY